MRNYITSGIIKLFIILFCPILQGQYPIQMGNEYAPSNSDLYYLTNYQYLVRVKKLIDSVEYNYKTYERYPEIGWFYNKVRNHIEPDNKKKLEILLNLEYRANFDTLRRYFSYADSMTLDSMVKVYGTKEGARIEFELRKRVARFIPMGQYHWTGMYDDFYARMHRYWSVWVKYWQGGRTASLQISRGEYDEGMVFIEKHSYKNYTPDILRKRNGLIEEYLDERIYGCEERQDVCLKDVMYAEFHTRSMTDAKLVMGESMKNVRFVDLAFMSPVFLPNVLKPSRKKIEVLLIGSIVDLYVKPTSFRLKNLKMLTLESASLSPAVQKTLLRSKKLEYIGFVSMHKELKDFEFLEDPKFKHLRKLKVVNIDYSLSETQEKELAERISKNKILPSRIPMIEINNRINDPILVVALKDFKGVKLNIDLTKPEMISAVKALKNVEYLILMQVRAEQLDAILPHLPKLKKLVACTCEDYSTAAVGDCAENKWPIFSPDFTRDVDEKNEQQLAKLRLLYPKIEIKSYLDFEEIP